MQVQKVVNSFYLVSVILLTLSSCVKKPIGSGLTVSLVPNTENQTDNKGVAAPEAIAPKTPFDSKGRFLPETEKKWRIQHTALTLSFDWNKRHVIGDATIKMTPWFYDQDSIVLDAVGFKIQSVNELISSKISSTSTNSKTKSSAPKFDEQTRKYKYDNEHLVIFLDSKVKAGKEVNININYTAMPDSAPVGGAEAITSDKGLFFILPDSNNPDKPNQIWTQGETSSNRKWFPTIDSPNQKSTQEMYITVDSSYKTLSNGTLVYSLNNAGGTRTDYWKMDQPHSIYLFMLAVGKYTIVKDSYKGKEVSYYVEPKWGKYARDIFGRTPAMMDYFSALLGVEYPWAKYSQVVVRDYVSGAMENTTATVQREAVQKTDRELLDADEDEVISHELFHHWFGDLVTCERWGELPLNESFANYSEYLWYEKRDGRDAAEMHQASNLEQYLDEVSSKDVPLIRFYESDMKNEMDMFDRHSYNKGGSTLNYLRRTIGDDAFFASLKTYLTDNAYKNTEIEHLRLAFEKTTGKDFHQFFNTYFLKNSYTELEASNYFENGETVLLIKARHTAVPDEDFNMVLDVDLLSKDKIKSERLTLKGGNNKFTFAGNVSSVLVDAEHAVVGTIAHKKSESELMNQLKFAKLAVHRQAAFDSLTVHKNPLVKEVIKIALNDSYYSVRRMALGSLEEQDSTVQRSFLAELRSIASNDKSHKVRVPALRILGNLKDNASKEIVEAAYKAQSIREEAAAIQAGLNMGLVSAKEYKTKVSKSPSDYSVAARTAVFKQMIKDKEANGLAIFNTITKDANGQAAFDIWKLGSDYAVTQPINIQEQYFNSTIKRLPSLDLAGKVGAFWGLSILAKSSKNQIFGAELDKVVEAESNIQLKSYYKYFLSVSE